MTVSYYNALDKAADLAPNINKPTEFIKWAEDMCEILSHIYSRDYTEVTEALVEKAREAQDNE